MFWQKHQQYVSWQKDLVRALVPLPIAPTTTAAAAAAGGGVGDKSVAVVVVAFGVDTDVVDVDVAIAVGCGVGDGNCSMLSHVAPCGTAAAGTETKLGQRVHKVYVGVGNDWEWAHLRQGQGLQPHARAVGVVPRVQTREGHEAVGT